MLAAPGQSLDLTKIDACQADTQYPFVELEFDTVYTDAEIQALVTKSSNVVASHLGVNPTTNDGDIGPPNP